MPFIDREEVTDAVITALATIGKPVGDMTAPVDSDGMPLDLPYSIVYPVLGGDSEGPAWVEPDAIFHFHYQISSVGVTRRQAEWLADRVRRVMLERDGGGRFVTAIAPTGMSVLDRRIAFTPAGVEREVSLYSVPEAFIVTVTST